MELRNRLYEQLDSLTLIDPHTHINAMAPASETLADILGYHYYTELAHSAGLAKADIEDPELTPKDKVARLVEYLGPLENTIQASWLIEMAQVLFDFDDDRITTDNWEPLYDHAAERMSQPHIIPYNNSKKTTQAKQPHQNLNSNINFSFPKKPDNKHAN